MNSRQLAVTAGVDEAIRAHGQATYPHECCGALLGRDNQVSDILALPNTTEEGPRRRFLVRPSDYREAERRASELGAELLGFYHSHPDHPARPSQYDLDHAWPTFAYIIVAVAGNTSSRQSAEGATADGAAAAGEMTVWYLKDDRSSFEEGSLEHGENSHPDTAQAVHG
jgi:proteasome lid subunit RPN8/RPN11